MDVKGLYRVLAERKQVNALGATVQMAHETGWFRSKPMMAHWNLGGIKCTRSWRNKGGACFDAKTWEESGGVRQDLVLGFRSYPSLSAFLDDYERLIRAYYPLSDRSIDCVWLYYAGLHGKWATDSAYFKRLVAMTPRVAGELGISLDTLRGSHRAALERGYPQGWMVATVERSLGNHDG